MKRLIVATVLAASVSASAEEARPKQEPQDNEPAVLVAVAVASVVAVDWLFFDGKYRKVLTEKAKAAANEVMTKLKTAETSK